jgi:hypothetical protein
MLALSSPPGCIDGGGIEGEAGLVTGQAQGSRLRVARESTKPPESNMRPGSGYGRKWRFDG